MKATRLWRPAPPGAAGHDAMNAAIKPRDLQDIERFLDILEKRVRELSQSTAALGDMIGTDSSLRFSDYVRSRDLSSECWAFSIVIERRIDDYSGSERETLRQRFELLTVVIWSTLLDCSLKFLDALSRQPHLPLGSREIFVREIKILYDAHHLLDNPRYASVIDDGMRGRQHQAERILTEIIDRAPALLNLDL
jgi:hypothetical protein